MINSSLSVKGKVTTIKIEKKCGSHSRMTIDVKPDNMSELSELLAFVSTGTQVDANIDGTLVMCGKITNVTGKTTYSGAAVSVLVMSDSVESDMIKTSRVFQSPEKTYKDISSKISDKVTFKINKDELASKKEENVVIQYNESDFEFANRIAKENNTRLFVCDFERGRNEIIIADDMNSTLTAKNNDIISANIDVTDFYEALDIEYREYIELGTKVKIDNNEYVVVSVNAEYKDDNSRFFYRL